MTHLFGILISKPLRALPWAGPISRRSFRRILHPSPEAVDELREINDSEMGSASKLFIDAQVGNGAGAAGFGGMIYMGYDRPGDSLDILISVNLVTGEFDVDFRSEAANPHTGAGLASFGTGTFRPSTQAIGTEGWDVPAGQDWIILKASWAEASNGVGLVVYRPDGSAIVEADFAAAGISVIAELTTDYARTIKILSPQAGVWSLGVDDGQGLGMVQYEALLPDGMVDFTLATATLSGDGMTASLDWTQVGTDEIQITLYAVRAADGMEVNLGTRTISGASGTLQSVSLTSLSAGDWTLRAEASDGFETFVTNETGPLQIAGTADVQLSGGLDEDAIVTGQFVTATVVLANRGDRAATNVGLALGAGGLAMVEAIEWNGALYAPAAFTLESLGIGQIETLILHLKTGSLTGTFGIDVRADGPSADSGLSNNGLTLSSPIRNPFERLVGTALADDLAITVLNGVIFGGDADDTLMGAGSDDLLYGEADDDSLVGGDGDDYLSGGSGNDTAYGGTGSDTLWGGDGNDLLDGENGIDTLQGGSGSDVYVIDNVGDTYVELAGAGRDTVLSSVSHSLLSNTENLTLTGELDIDGRGNAAQNTVLGNTGANVLDGLGGNDRLFGGTGGDRLNGGDGNDTMLGGSGADSLSGDAGNDRMDGGLGDDTALFLGTTAAKVNLSLTAAQITGFGKDTLLSIENITSGDGKDRLTGNAVANVLDSGAGNDSLDGGAGNDILSGGMGADRFSFTTALTTAGVDTITDFAVNSDRLLLDNLVFTGLSDGALAADAFWSDGLGIAHDDTDRIIYDSATGGLYFDADGTGAAERVQFAVVSVGLSLTNTDFLII